MPVTALHADATFEPAPAGFRVRFATFMSIVAVVIADVVAVTLMLQDRRPPPWPVLVLFALLPVFIAAMSFVARIQQYRVVGAELQVVLRIRTVRIPLDGLREVARDPEAFRGVRKRVGNDGLGAINGRFWSKRLGRFRAFVTATENAVVLRWTDHTLVVSPEHPDYFVEAVRRHAGLDR